MRITWPKIKNLFFDKFGIRTWFTLLIFLIVLFLIILILGKLYPGANWQDYARMNNFCKQKAGTSSAIYKDNFVRCVKADQTFEEFYYGNLKK